ncbi:MAG TPA: DUF2381 family protein, partial [Archangium sp.]|nr:DUF2381 family protein [Archangium sp.]
EPESVALEGKERFALVDPARSTLKLVPSEQLRPGERLRLTVRFPGTSAPAGATLLLVVHAAVAAPLVYVHRQPREADSYRQELAVAKEEARQCHEENARLRAERNVPGGLAGLLASGLLAEMATGVLAADIGERVQQFPSNALREPFVESFRAGSRVALRLSLDNPPGAAPWVAEGATLVRAGRQGLSLKVLTLWQPAPVPSGKNLRRQITPDLLGVASTEEVAPWPVPVRTHRRAGRWAWRIGGSGALHAKVRSGPTTALGEGW